MRLALRIWSRRERSKFMVERINVQNAHERLQAYPETLLVCAYDSDDKFREHHLEGAISLDELRMMEDHLPADRELIFYCA
jgi:rhodanese-related sulfurtransferase